jgi:lysophospholipase L1-like esterase
LILLAYFNHLNSISFIKVQRIQDEEFQKKDSLLPVAIETVDPKIKIKDTASKKILLAGDSMADGLLKPLHGYCNTRKHKLIRGGWTSSTIISWSFSKKLSKLIKKYEPDYVILALGSNELYTTELTYREPLIRNILSEAGKTKFVWVGPPHWQEDYGLDSLLKTTLGDKIYFSSKKMFLSEPLKRDKATDKIHPSASAFRVWADSIVTFIERQPDFSITFVRPK